MYAHFFIIINFFTKNSTNLQILSKRYAIHKTEKISYYKRLFFCILFYRERIFFSNDNASTGDTVRLF